MAEITKICHFYKYYTSQFLIFPSKMRRIFRKLPVYPGYNNPEHGKFLRNLNVLLLLPCLKWLSLHCRARNVAFLRTERSFQSFCSECLWTSETINDENFLEMLHYLTDDCRLLQLFKNKCNTLQSRNSDTQTKRRNCEYIPGFFLKALTFLTL